MIQELRSACYGEEFDYQFLMSKLTKYKYPRNVINRLIKSESIIRVKKGLYIFGPKYRREPISRPLLANLIYGPSYVSREFALAHYGLIPERVEMVTCMTTQKNKEFETPVGRFHYKHLSVQAFTVGVDRLPLDEKRYFLMASPEKALTDLVALQKGIINQSEMLEHLTENLRIDAEDLTALDKDRLRKISYAYRKPIVRLLNTVVQGVN